MNQLMILEGKQAPQLTKTERETGAELLVNQVCDGELDPLEIVQGMKAIEDIFSMVRKNERFDDAAKEALRLHGKSITLNGHTITTGETGVYFDFSVCNDPELPKLQKAAELANKALKERQDFLKKLPEKGLKQVDFETGEEYVLYRPAKTSKTSLKITLNK